MPSSTPDALFDAFQAASRSDTASTGPLFDPEIAIASTTADLLQLASTLAAGGPDETMSSSASVNVAAEAEGRLNANPTTEPIATSTTTSSGGSSALSVATSVLESGFGIVPLVTGLLGLFGGGSQEPAPLEKYIMPDRLFLTGASTGNSIEDSDYDQFGMPRLYENSPGNVPPTQSAGGSVPSSGAATASQQQITVNIQALDSQSFLDRSSDIAQAVRQAMLNLSSMNDVVAEL